MTKPFSFSWSRLKNFRTCPKRHWHLDIQKDIKEPDSEHLIWGHEVHEALANYVSKDARLPQTMQHYKEVADPLVRLRKAGAPVKVEQKLAMDSEFKPVSFFDNKAWFRGVLDVIVVGDTIAGTMDWKTGKMPEDGDTEYEQLALSAQLVFAHYPGVDLVETSYVWLGYSDTTERTYKRDGMVPVWNKLWPQITVMTDAYRTTSYPAKPSGLCIRHCPVKSCVYYGKGNR